MARQEAPYHALMYCRVSEDREGRSLAVSRQERELREVCSAERLELVDVFSDNHISGQRVLQEEPS